MGGISESRSTHLIAVPLGLVLLRIRSFAAPYARGFGIAEKRSYVMLTSSYVP
jgi:hypothetical protein